MLQKSKDKRILLKECLADAWFKDQHSQLAADVNSTITSRLRSFRAPKRLQLEAMTFLANNLPNSEQLDMQSLRNAFKQIDTQNSGYLNQKDIEVVLRQQNIPEQEIHDVFKSLSQGSESKTINYSLFLAATIDRKKTLTLQNLQFAFHHFDTKNSGKIRKIDIIEVFKREGREISETDLEEMMGTTDTISFDQFTKQMMEVINAENVHEDARMDDN